ncbi:hypothetical protein AAFX91_39845 [Bradyrhizobium sp. 31Argb]
MARSATEQKNGLTATFAIFVSAMKKALVHLIRMCALQGALFSLVETQAG